MPNCLFNGRKMRPKALRPEVELGPAFIMWQRVNEVPSLVAFRRQTTLPTGMQHRDPNPLTSRVKVNTLCCIAKAEERPNSTQKAIEAGRSGAARSEAFMAAESDLISGTLPPFG